MIQNRQMSEREFIYELLRLEERDFSRERTSRSFRCKRLVLFLLLTLLAAHTSKTFIRNYDWLDEYSIFMSGLKVNDRNAKLFNNVGHALESQGRFKEALNFFNMAVQVQGDDIGAHINVGRTYNHLKMFKEAEDAYLKVRKKY